MKIMKNGKVLGCWNPLSFVGFIINAVGVVGGLITGSQLVSQITNPVANGASVPIQSLEVVVSVLLVIIGFSLMVAGADPFDDVSDQFHRGG